MILKIQKWYGRLGNNIFQVFNALCIGLRFGYNIIFPKHPFFNTIKITIDPNSNNDNQIYTDIFFYPKKLIKDFGLSWLYFVNTPIVIEYLRKIFIIDVNKLPKFKNDHLVIHIRSGDIFVKPHPNYISPPLCYYKKIINEGSYKTIQIISENKNNPCINQLLKLYPQIIFKEQDLLTDIKIILSSQNLICSVGTFIPALMKISKNIEKLFVASYAKNGFEQISKKIKSTNLNEYLKSSRKIWKNADKQKNLMINYDFPKLI